MTDKAISPLRRRLIEASSARSRRFSVTLKKMVMPARPAARRTMRWTRTDLGLIANTGCSVAHCPTPFARYGPVMENFRDYLRAGVNTGLGTDTTPHNLVEQMRKAAIFARTAARDIATVTTADLLHAARLVAPRL